MVLKNLASPWEIILYIERKKIYLHLFSILVADPLKESAVWLEEVDPEELRVRSGSVRPVSPQMNTNQDPLGTGTDIFRLVLLHLLKCTLEKNSFQ